MRIRTISLHPPLVRFLLGATLGGVLLASGAGFIGSLVPPHFQHDLLLLSILISTVLLAFGARWTSYPQRRDQVPVRWASIYPIKTLGLLWGLTMGLGFLTYLRTAGFWNLVLIMIVAPGIAWVAAVYGFARGLSLVIAVRLDTSVETTFVTHQPQLPYRNLLQRTIGGVGLLAAVSVW